MKALIVDDEPESHVVLKSELISHHPEIEIVGTAFNKQDGFDLVKALRPDLLFLDVQMPDGTGFDLLEALHSENMTFQVIFITAYNQFAQTAIRLGALDYLLKPPSSEALTNAILKAQIKRLERIQFAQMQIIRDTLFKLEERKLPKRMSISTQQGVLYFPTDQIIRLEAMENFTEFKVQKEDRRLIASHNLKKYEVDFSPFPTFMRVHRSYIINLLMVDAYVKGEKAFAIMKDEFSVPIARRFRKAFEMRIESL